MKYLLYSNFIINFIYTQLGFVNENLELSLKYTCIYDAKKIYLLKKTLLTLLIEIPGRKRVFPVVHYFN